MSKKKIAVIRALDVRLIQAEYAHYFDRLKVSYVSNYHREIESYAKLSGLDWRCLPLEPWLAFDPVKALGGKTLNKSWLVFNRQELTKLFSGFDYFQIQEPYFLYSGQVAEFAKKLKKSLICAPWTCFHHPSTYIPPYSLSVRKVLEQTDLFILRTNKVNEYLDRFQIPDQKKVMIYHGLDLKRFCPPTRKRERKEIKILFTGQLVAHKGLDDILDVFPSIVKRAKKNVRLVICGVSGGLKNKMLTMAKTLPIDYKGYVSNWDMPKIYKECDIFCGPSKEWYTFGIKRASEGFGFVFLEAMASGLPVVTNCCGAIEEVVGDDNYLSEQGDRKSLYHSLLELIHDDQARKEIGNKNRARAEKFFDLEKQVAAEEEVILRTI